MEGREANQIVTCNLALESMSIMQPSVCAEPLRLVDESSTVCELATSDEIRPVTGL